MITAGIDAGSRAIKIVLLDTTQKCVLASAVCDQGVDQHVLTRQLFDRLLQENNLQSKDIQVSVATGYGRHLLDFCDTTVTEISCHAAGVLHHIPEISTVIDIGGQDSKLAK